MSEQLSMSTQDSAPQPEAPMSENNPGATPQDLRVLRSSGTLDPGWVHGTLDDYNAALLQHDPNAQPLAAIPQGMTVVEKHAQELNNAGEPVVSDVKLVDTDKLAMWQQIGVSRHVVGETTTTGATAHAADQGLPVPEEQANVGAAGPVVVDVGKAISEGREDALLDQLSTLRGQGANVNLAEIMSAYMSAGHSDTLVRHIQTLGELGLEPTYLAHELIQRGRADIVLRHLREFRVARAEMSNIARELVQSGHINDVKVSQDEFGDAASPYVQDLIARWYQGS